MKLERDKNTFIVASTGIGGEKGGRIKRRRSEKTKCLTVESEWEEFGTKGKEYGG